MEGIGKINEVFGNQQYKRDISNIKKNRIAFGKDELELSSKGRSLAEINREASQIPTIRDERIKTIKAKIRSGNYQIEPDKIARDLVNKWFSGKE